MGIPNLQTLIQQDQQDQHVLLLDHVQDLEDLQMTILHQVEDLTLDTTELLHREDGDHRQGDTLLLEEGLHQEIDTHLLESHHEDLHRQIEEVELHLGELRRAEGPLHVIGLHLVDLHHVDEHLQEKGIRQEELLPQDRKEDQGVETFCYMNHPVL